MEQEMSDTPQMTASNNAVSIDRAIEYLKAHTEGENRAFVEVLFVRLQGLNLEHQAQPTDESALWALDSMASLIREKNALKYQVATLTTALAAANARVQALEWRPITPESLPTVLDEVGSQQLTYWRVNSIDWFAEYDGWMSEGWTHYRPSSPPAQKGPSDGK